MTYVQTIHAVQKTPLLDQNVCIVELITNYILDFIIYCGEETDIFDSHYTRNIHYGVIISISAQYILNIDLQKQTYHIL